MRQPGRGRQGQWLGTVEEQGSELVKLSICDQKTTISAGIFTIIAEIGVDMRAFHSAGHLASWAGLCPGNNESAGKKRSGKARKGNVVLKATLVNAAIAGSGGRGHKGTYLADKFRRLAARRDR
jgi:transposase